MKSSRLLALVASAAVSACAGKPELHFAWDHAARFSGLQTYTWYADPTFQFPHGGSIVDGRFIDARVREAVERGLREKGLQKSEEGRADFYVSYHTSAEGVVSQDKFGLYDWWTMTIAVESAYRKKGGLTLDIRDRDHKLVWRGAITVIMGTNPEEVGRDIDGAVGDLLAKFPPPPGTEAR